MSLRRSISFHCPTYRCLSSAPDHSAVLKRSPLRADRLLLYLWAVAIFAVEDFLAEGLSWLAFSE